MSWDVAIVCIRGEFRPIADVQAADYLPLGDLEYVRAAIRSACPTATWSNPFWAVYGEGLDVEINLKSVESSHCVLLSFHGDRDPIPWVLALTQPNGWLAVDCSSSEFIDPTNLSRDSWEGFRGLVDNIHARNEVPPNPCDG
jgi:hypothetical protein